ncbi:MAG: hypothetical protein JXO48_01995 [Deltaproteobacteria bacterium]|nr:hypothetical protein [Deltaproteobacteria bacterium]
MKVCMKIFRYLPVLIVLCVLCTAAGAESYVEEDHDGIGIYKSDPSSYEKVRALGGRVVTVAGGPPFFVHWIPEGFEKTEKKRLLVVLHGTGGNAYRHLLNFTDVASRKGFAIASIQWGWPARQPSAKKKEYTYLSNSADTYRIVAGAVQYLSAHYGVDTSLTAWLGFSRSATQCASFAFHDKESGNNYIRLFIAASGGVSPNLPAVRLLLSGRYGEKPLSGTHFYLWGGLRDTTRGENMMRSRDLIEKLGGTVDILRIGPEGHGGFNHRKEYQIEAVDLWYSL